MDSGFGSVRILDFVLVRLFGLDSAGSDFGFSFGLLVCFGFDPVRILDLVWFVDSVLDFFLLTIQRCSEYFPSHSLFDKQSEFIDFWNISPVNGFRSH